jgi:hypothetical protein
MANLKALSDKSIGSTPKVQRGAPATHDSAKSPAKPKRVTTGKPKAKDMPKYGMGNQRGANDNETSIRAKQNRLIHK